MNLPVCLPTTGIHISVWGLIRGIRGTIGIVNGNMNAYGENYFTWLARTQTN